MGMRGGTRGGFGNVIDRMHRLKEAMRGAGDLQVAIGFPADVDGLGTPEPAYDGKASIIEVALANNYGIGVPKRAFMEEARPAMEKTYREVLKNTAPLLREGKAAPEKVLDLAGLKAEEDVRKSIMEGDWQPNSPATIARKKSDRPLVDTGTMKNRVTHVVRKAK